MDSFAGREVQTVTAGEIMSLLTSVPYAKIAERVESVGKIIFLVFKCVSPDLKPFNPQKLKKFIEDLVLLIVSLTSETSSRV